MSKSQKKNPYMLRSRGIITKKLHIRCDRLHIRVWDFSILINTCLIQDFYILINTWLIQDLYMLINTWLIQDLYMLINTCLIQDFYILINTIRNYYVNVFMVAIHYFTIIVCRYFGG